MDLQLPAPLEAYFTHSHITPARVIPLTGDASDRRYFRVHVADAPPFVLALYSAPFDALTLPFLNVADLFAAMPVPVPRVLGHMDALGVLALEDLGDLTLQAQLGGVDAATRDALYARAVDHIVTIQTRGEALRSSRFVPYGLAFDVEKLGWEMEFFIRHFLENYRGVTLDAPLREALARELAAIVAELAALPRVLCHRDYHSRNLMVHGGDLFVIDFQDARLGPSTYDLASLLRDSYVDLPQDLVTSLIESFAQRIGRTDLDVFVDEFDVMALQRNLKALGTFGYQATARANPVYGQYVPRTLGYVRQNLDAHPRFQPLRAVLSEVVPELR
jgi:aminoglycoside/choline kinase family phosphotransferase